jgi:phosphonate transport system substrate-binding protein
MNRVFLTATLILSLACIPSAFAAEKFKLIIGVIPELNLVKQMERFVPLSDYLDQKTGMNVEIKPFSNYGQLFEGLRDGEIDGGFFGSLIYGITHARIGIIPLARPVQPDGSSTYTGLIFIRKDLNIKKPADMKGKTIALADPATTAGYLAPKEYFAKNGINIDKEMKILWTGNHEAAIQAVMSNQAEIGGAKKNIVSKYRKRNRMFDKTIEIINENPKKGLPDNTLAVRKGLDPARRDLLLKVLLAMNSDPEGRKALERFGALKFIPTTDADYKHLYDMVRHLQIDLTKYPYSKEQNIPPSRK